MRQKPDPKPSYPASERSIRRKTMFSFLVFGVLLCAGWAGFRWVYHAPSAARDHVQAPLRKVLDLNETIFASTFDSSRLARTFPKEKAAKKVRVNGNLGLSGTVDTLSWRLHVIRNSGDTLTLSLAEIKRLPKTEVIFDFKCIEGWDQVSHWGGVRLSDFLKANGLSAERGSDYIGLATPDGGYYVGIDMASALQEQTILCYELNGQPLPQSQGYPLRLIIPVKYGIKHLKRIGAMYFSDTPPPDYWARQGYDYYSGH